ncbi:MAG: hypothetical protein M0R80_08005 [Proteobacteria bacterium]|jgi:hypothetical protein|nr:hypothetical protein [Pseudomonadota bacterium]
MINPVWKLAELVGKKFQLEVAPTIKLDRSHSVCYIPVVVRTASVENGHFYLTCTPEVGSGELIIDNPALLIEDNGQPWKG